MPGLREVRCFYFDRISRFPDRLNVDKGFLGEYPKSYCTGLQQFETYYTYTQLAARIKAEESARSNVWKRLRQASQISMLDIIYVRKYLAGNQKVHPVTCGEVLSI